MTDSSTLRGQIDAAIARAGVRPWDRLALDFVERHGADLRYVAPWRWLEWTGARWERRHHRASLDVVASRVLALRQREKL
jgi:hypothetical protein